MTSHDWRDHFRRNRHGRLPIPWDAPVRPPVTGRAATGRSLACFQLGESSDGKRLRRLAWRTGDPVYAEAIELFLAEEHEHARLLGRVLDRFETPRLLRQWSHWLFRHCRHALGFRSEIVVLLMAEIAGTKYYATVLDASEDAAVRRVCEQLLYDEHFHVRFHCEYLHRWLAVRSRAARWLAWWGLTGLFAGAIAVVAWDHRDALIAMGGSSKEYLAGAWLDFSAARRAIFTGEMFAGGSIHDQAIASQAAGDADPRSIA
jgi:hypothetical protein